MNYSGLIKSIANATGRLHDRVASVAVQSLVIRNWLVGAWLVEFEQSGKDRAKYGQHLLESVAADLAKKEIKGLTDPRVLRDCRALYRCYPQIRGSATREFEITTRPSGGTETQSLTTKPIRGSSTREFPPSLALEDLMQLSCQWGHTIYDHRSTIHERLWISRLRAGVCRRDRGGAWQFLTGAFPPARAG
jgi:hypothetical protein